MEIGKLAATVKGFLSLALKPVGETMYIWGGGWNEDGSGAGEDALRIGINPEWRKFFMSRTSKYNYKDYLFRRGLGLDCSGYVGWVMYNYFMQTCGTVLGGGYVFKSGEQARRFADMGLGSFTDAANVTDFKAGDIMSSSGHVYIVAGSCADGSVVLLHSSPPGVQLTGTYSKQGSKFSQAAYLAKTYTSTYYSEWYEKFGTCIKDTSYLTDYSQFRWTLGGIITDPERLREKSASAVLAELFR